MSKLRIGLLVPYSGMFRNLRHDFKQGLELGLSRSLKNGDFEYITEFIQLGEPKVVEQALRKLVFFENVDLIVGMVGTKVILDFRALFEGERIPVIINNFGAFIPTYQFRSEYLFYNSLHLWKSEYGMGIWAQTRYGAEPSLNLSLYEAGYNMHNCFQLGAAAAGALTLKVNTLHNKTGPPDTRPLIEYIRQQYPNHAHALLSGPEGEQFLDFYKQTGLTDKVPLTVNPFMVEDGLAINPALAEGYVNACTWAYSLETALNKQFTQNYEETYRQKANAISLLTYESGLAIGAALEAISGSHFTKEALAQELARSTASGPRGNIALATTPLAANQPVYIRVPRRNAITGLIENQIMEEVKTPSWESPDVLNASYQNVSGWQNPYLCV